MKKQVIFLISAILTGLVWTSCAPESEPQRAYYNSYGTIITEDELNFTVLLDNGAILIPGDQTIEGITNDDRVLLGFYVDSEETVNGEYIVNATVVEMNLIYTQDIIPLTEEIQDSIGYEGIIVNGNNVWLSQKHLNILFSFYGGGTVHSINLVKPIGEQTDEEGYQILEFRHNANEDLMSQLITGPMSFRMENLYEDGLDSINFKVRSYDYDSVLTEVKGTYHFLNQESAMKAIKSGPIDFDTDYTYLQLQ